MSFTHQVKLEILNSEYSVEEAIDFVSGLAAISGMREDNKITLKMNNEDIAEKIRDLLNQLDIKITKTADNRNWIILKDFKPNHNIKMPAAFFAGIFVGGGSVSDPETTSYHLELQFIDGNLATKVKEYLNKYGFSFVEIKRRKNWVIYQKKSELITDFLKVVKAYNSVMSFEDTRINRDFKNQLNRYSNLDSYNQKKLAEATVVFLEWYHFVIDHKLQHLFTHYQWSFYELKARNPYLSLADLLNKFNKKEKTKKTRAALGHYLIKLKAIYSDHI